MRRCYICHRRLLVGKRAPSSLRRCRRRKACIRRRARAEHGQHNYRSFAGGSR